MEEIEERFTFDKHERLSGTKRIDALFEKGKSFICYPLRVLYMEHEQSTQCECSILVSVPKKRMKKAVHRNRIKRLIRESYRLNKKLITSSELDEKSIDVAFIYVKDVASDYKDIQKAMEKALKRIVVSIKKTDDCEQTI